MSRGIESVAPFDVEIVALKREVGQHCIGELGSGGTVMIVTPRVDVQPHGGGRLADEVNTLSRLIHGRPRQPVFFIG